ncbi:MAG: hypothetical protein WCF44_08235 [Candidatus Methylophosphatis roskildensis]
MTKITETALAELDADKRLLSPVHKDSTPTPGRFGFRGELALKFAEQFADEARPPEVKCDQVMTVAEAGATTIPFFTGFVQSFEHLQLLAEVLGDKLAADGKYFLFCGNIDISKKYQVAYGGATFYILPLEEATVYNELLDLFGIERNDLKKLDTGAKLDRIAKAAAGFRQNWPAISFEDGLAIMGPIKVRENRPV